jgi:hypothetical protein
MHKDDAKKLVDEAYRTVKEELGPDVMSKVGTTGLAELVQKKLPTKPMYGVATIKKIIYGGRG